MDWGRTCGHAKCHRGRREEGIEGLAVNEGRAPVTLLLCFRIAAQRPGRWRVQ